MKSWMPLILLMVCAAMFSCGSPEAGQAEVEASMPKEKSVMHEVSHELVPIDTPVVLDTIEKAILLGKINPAKDTNFTLIATKYTPKANIYMRSAAYAAFEEMYAAAAKEGVILKIISATRPFDSQKGIWEAKWTGTRAVGGKNLSVSVPDPVERAKTILRYSSMPGTSRHHWGTDIDLNDLENSYFEAGTGKKIYDWLTAHAADYGFCQPYSPVGPNRPNGYQEERWHWSYMPIASRFLKAYQNQIELTDIHGFKGAETAEGLNVIENYVSGIAMPCREWIPVKTD